MAKKSSDGPRKPTPNPKVTPKSPTYKDKGTSFTENRGNTINVSGPIPVAPKPPTKPAMPPSTTSKKDGDGK